MTQGCYLGIDTSNYTTSAALYFPESGDILQKKLLLPVPEGARGLRQSDAVFHHTKQLPALIRELFLEADAPVLAVAVSDKPRDIPGSYMPCFLAGVSAAQCIAAAQHLPFYRFSHQAGHLAAALFGAEQTELRNAPFLAFHLSGGTTDLLLVTPDPETIFHIEQIGDSSDLNAGQLIDRVGVRLALPFPCGVQMDRLSQHAQKQFRTKPAVQGLMCSISGLENQCQKLIEQGETAENVSLFCLESLCETVSLLATHAREQYGSLPLVCSGGVAANSLLRTRMTQRFGAHFAPPAFSQDNAAGIALLSNWKA